MSVGPNPSNRQWLRRLIAGQPHQVIGGSDDPYLLRWYVIPRNPVLNVYVHKFLRSDDDRALHDHPWWFVSMVLKGEYTEITEHGWIDRRAGSLAFRPAAWRHRVQLLPRFVTAMPITTDSEETPCWTLILTGRRSRSWGFWCPQGFVHWRDFGDAGCGEVDR